MPVSVSLGCPVQGLALPHCNPSDPITLEAGVLKRFARTPPQPDRCTDVNSISFENFVKFVQRKVPEMFTPLPATADTSFETWLAKTPYPDFRKKELTHVWNQKNRTLRPKDFLVKSFMKDESYTEYKHARIINPRSDAFKCAFGPYIRLIEEEVYKHPAFIKKIPVADRPRYIEEMIEVAGAKYFWADFTAFESHFTPEVLRRVEFILYKHMAKNLPDKQKFFDCLDVIAGTNHCVFKYFTLNCEGRRMSGEMNTSLGNGFVNLMLINYLFDFYGENNRTVVEGDDSNTSFMNKCPTVEDFAKLGFTVKCGVVDKLEEMSFCGLVYTKEDRINVCDPLKALASFGWGKMNYVNARKSVLKDLLRMKALSFAHQYPGCPIVQELAHYALRCTRGRDISHLLSSKRVSTWERESFQLNVTQGAIPYRDIPLSTRLLCERVYGVSISQQLAVEDYLRSLTEIQPLAGPIRSLNFPVEWSDYHDFYSQVVDVNSLSSNYPAFPNARYAGFEPEDRKSVV